MLRSFKSIAKIAFKGILLIVTCAVLFGICAIVGTIWRSEDNLSKASDTSITIYAYSNGFHSDIIVPIDNDLTLKKLPIDPLDFDEGLIGAKYLVIGWGSLTAYTSLLEIKDMSPSIIAKSLFFDQSVLHIQPLSRQPKGPKVYPLQTSIENYVKLLDFIADTFERRNDSSSTLMAGVTHGYGDVFYRSTLKYNPFYSCNAWTGEALRIAGAPVGYWTPFAQSIEWSLNGL